MIYGFEVYGDRCLTEDSYEHGPKVVDSLQNRELPKLDGNPLIDNIINKCWHNKCKRFSMKGLMQQEVERKEFCQDLEKRILPHLLSSGEPEQIGFTFDQYRHSL